MNISAWILYLGLCCWVQNSNRAVVLAELQKEQGSHKRNHDTILREHLDLQSTVQRITPTLSESVNSGSEQAEVRTTLQHTYHSNKEPNEDNESQTTVQEKSTKKRKKDTASETNPSNSKDRKKLTSSNASEKGGKTRRSFSRQPVIPEVFLPPKQTASSVLFSSFINDSSVVGAKTKGSSDYLGASTVEILKVHEPKKVIVSSQQEVESLPANTSIPSVDGSHLVQEATAIEELPISPPRDGSNQFEESGQPDSSDAGSPAALEPFSQWAEKKRAEQEHKGSTVKPTGTSQGKSQSNSKMRQKNYALSECGAKVIATNAEAQSASSVLNNHNDEYMLNPCTAKIWLVVELCEAVQASKIELANFELFSSSPRTFNVYCSDRFPTREWVSLGKFEAKDEKTLQSFNLQVPVENKHFFYKYIKVEMGSHYGSEHFCPLSLVRVYGTSEMEVLETDGADSGSGANADDDDDEFLDDVNSQPQNLIITAKDAVISIVKKAAEALSRDKSTPGGDKNVTSLNVSHEEVKATHNNSNEIQCVTLVWPCTYPQIRNVSEDKALDYLSCNYPALQQLTSETIIQRILPLCLCSTSICSGQENFDIQENSPICRYLLNMLGKVRFLSLCLLYRFMAAHKSGEYLNCSVASHLPLDNKDTLLEKGSDLIQSTFEVPSSEVDTISSVANDSVPVFVNPTPKPSLEAVIESNDNSVSSLDQTPRTSPVSESLQDQIHPTKTIKESHDSQAEKQVVAGDNKSSEVKDQQSSIDGSVPTKSIEEQAPSEVVSSKDITTIPQSSLNIEGSMEANVKKLASKDVSSSLDASTVNGDSLGTDDLLSDIKMDSDSSGCDIPVGVDAVLTDIPESGMISSAQTSTSTSSGSGSTLGANRTSGPGNQKESVFVRLSNRIKALEVNMSLSSQYLEELSQRYRKQMEEMQRAFNKTISALNDTAKRAHERDVKQQEIITLMQVQIDNLSQTVLVLQNEHEGTSLQIIERHFFLILLELFIAACIFVMFRRRSGAYSHTAVPGNADHNVLDEKTDYTDPALLKRRNSFTTVGSLSPSKKAKRRPSEEALNISGTYEELMIVEPVIPIMVEQPVFKAIEQKKKKQKNRKGSSSGGVRGELVRSSSNSTISSTCSRGSNGPSRKQSTSKLNAAAGIVFSANIYSGLGEEHYTKQVEEITPHLYYDGDIRETSAKISLNGIKNNGKYADDNCKRPYIHTIGNGVSDIEKPVTKTDKKNGLLSNGLVNGVHEVKKDTFTLKKLVQKLYVSSR